MHIFYSQETEVNLVLALRVHAARLTAGMRSFALELTSKQST